MMGGGGGGGARGPPLGRAMNSRGAFNAAPQRMQA